MSGQWWRRKTTDIARAEDKLFNLTVKRDLRRRSDKIYFLFLTEADSKLVSLDDLNEDYIKNHKVNFTVKKGSPLWRQIVRSKLREIAEVRRNV